LHTLKWADSRHWESTEKNVAVIKSAEDERVNEQLHRIDINMALQLPESS